MTDALFELLAFNLIPLNDSQVTNRVGIIIIVIVINCNLIIFSK